MAQNDIFVSRVSELKMDAVQLRRQAADLEYKADLKDGLAEELEKLRLDPGFASTPLPAQSFLVSADGGGRRPSVPGSVAHRAEGVLRTKGGTMRARDIAAAISAAGDAPAGKTPILSLVISAIRRRPDVFRKVKRGVYALVEKGPLEGPPVTDAARTP